MKFLIDQNIERRLTHFLREAGHDVTVVGVDHPAGLSDEQVLAIAYREQRILLTNDRSDFGELIFRYAHTHCGVILFRAIRSGDVVTKQERLAYVLAHYREQLHHFLVVSRNGVRVRKSETEEQQAA